MAQFDFIGTDVARLGESPLWDHRSQRLYWVDIADRRIAGSRLDGSDFAEWRYDQEVGSIALLEGGGLLAALADGFYTVDVESGAASPICRPGVTAPVRFNDGKADRDGRFHCATMTSRDLTSRNATLWRLDHDASATIIERDFVIGNATCFSPDGTKLYFGDSVEGIVRRYDYDRATGAISNRTALVNTRDYGSGPDGATVDSEGCLWVALIQAQKIARFAPDGALLQLIDTPMPFPTCVAFAGPDLDVLIVTAISDSGWSMKGEGPEAGRVLAIRGLGVTGIAETPYRHAP